jgi:hypothetical protein
MSTENIPVTLAIAAIVAVILTYWPGIPLLPVAVLLLALAIIIKS